MAKERPEIDEDWANITKLARISWTKDNPWKEDKSENIYTPKTIRGINGAT